jgi:DNA-binding MarR family transcriptional regulator
MARSVFETAGTSQDKTAKIVLGLERIANVFRNMLGEQAQKHNISPLQLQILLFIHFNNDGQARGSQIAREFSLAKATISIALKSMEQKRLITRKRDESDSRSYILELTDWGKQITHIAGFYPEPVRKIVALISDTDKNILLKNLNGIIGKLEQEKP